MHGSLHGVDFGSGFSRLVVEQIDGMTRMMPKQMVRPASRFAFRIHVCSPKEERLHYQMLQFQLTRFDSLMDPLMAGIEAPRVSAHGNQACFFLDG